MYKQTKQATVGKWFLVSCVGFAMGSVSACSGEGKGSPTSPSVVTPGALQSMASSTVVSGGTTAGYVASVGEESARGPDAPRADNRPGDGSGRGGRCGARAGRRLRLAVQAGKMTREEARAYLGAYRKFCQAVESGEMTREEAKAAFLGSLPPRDKTNAPGRMGKGKGKRPGQMGKRGDGKGKGKRPGQMGKRGDGKAK